MQNIYEGKEEINKSKAKKREGKSNIFQKQRKEKEISGNRKKLEVVES